MDEFIDIGQTQEEMNVDIALDGTTESIVDLHSLIDGEYPAMIVYGIKFRDTLKVLEEKCRSSYRAFNVWVMLDGNDKPTKVGKLPADIDTFLTMRYLQLSVVLLLNNEEVMNVDLNDTTTLESFI